MLLYMKTKAFLNWVKIKGVWGEKEEQDALYFYDLANGIDLVNCIVVKDDDAVVLWIGVYVQQLQFY